MEEARALSDLLAGIDGQGYKSYKRIRGSYSFDRYELSIDHVQGDPFAAPSRFRVGVDLERTSYPDHLWSNRSRATGFCTYLARQFSAQARGLRQQRGSGNSGLIDIDTPGQEILERTCVMVRGGRLEVRFFVGLPAAGRRVRGREAIATIFEDLPAVVASSLFDASANQMEATEYANANEDADALRRQLRPRNLVAFVASGSILPRTTGVAQTPLDRHAAIPFQPPPSLRIALDVPNAGTIEGMGLPQGVTLIVGGGFHGKSTLLQALQRGVYNHLPDDGRERVVTDETAVKIRAEDGRSICAVDISPFMGRLPDGSDTNRFSTVNASGSTSQAAATVEAIEAGARLLLIDEDTCASNFMTRDHRMQQLVDAASEPIVPFVDRLRVLHEQFGISTILVAGSSGDFFDVADTVVAMESYAPREVTAAAKSIAAGTESLRRRASGRPWLSVPSRTLRLDRLNPSKGKRESYVRIPGRHTILFGEDAIDLRAAEQLVDSSQTRALGAALSFCVSRWRDRYPGVMELLQEIERELETNGLDGLVGLPLPDLARFRGCELAMALNRLRSLVVGD